MMLEGKASIQMGALGNNSTIVQEKIVYKNIENK